MIISILPKVTPPMSYDEAIFKKSSPKEKYEIWVGDALLQWLRYDDRQFIRHGIDGEEPDLVYLIEGRKIGIEITVAYCNDHQAKKEWQKPGQNGVRRLFARPLGQPDKLITSRVQRAIDAKCSRHYTGADEVWLCIEQNSPFATISETRHRVATLNIPSQHSFKYIFLGFYANQGDGGGFRAYKLWPPELSGCVCRCAI